MCEISVAIDILKHLVGENTVLAVIPTSLKNFSPFNYQFCLKLKEGAVEHGSNRTWVQ